MRKNSKYTIYDKYVDNGISAATIKKRESLVKLLDNLDNFDIVLFTQLDRFSRERIGCQYYGSNDGSTQCGI